ncbi:MAG: CsiV family protein [Gammaproteobacteria bacterium]
MNLPRNTSNGCLSFVLALGAIGIAAAQTFPVPLPTALSGESDEEALPRYQIEIIAFAYHGFDPSEENFEQAPRGTLLDLLAPNLLETEEPGTPDPESLEIEAIPDLSLSELEALSMGSTAPTAPIEAADELASDSNALQTPVLPADQSTGETGAPEPGDGGDATMGSADDLVEPDFFEDGLWYRLLNNEQLELEDEFARLDRLDAYTPLVHGGWIQEGLPEEDAIPFELSLLGAFNPRGTIRLHVSRFLHVRLDLRYQSDTAAAPLAPRSFDRLAQLEFPPRYGLSVQRLTRSGELHFYDHPAFGVLVLVQPVPEEPETLEEELTPAA